VVCNSGIDSVPQRFEHRRRDRIEGVEAVQRNGGDRSVDLEQDFVAHLPSIDALTARRGMLRTGRAIPPVHARIGVDDFAVGIEAAATATPGCGVDRSTPDSGAHVDNVDL